MEPTHKPVCSCENDEYSAMAFGFTSGFDQKMSEPWVVMCVYVINARNEENLALYPLR
jgi:hypothetical protein